ncbi:protein-glutamate O-methyltransferase isoform X2 [Lingula anatina]|uniref:Sugar phosphate phosphatase n=1 Tax=Lingula anatina TaxID=7574 RepID=A0A1S3KC65_LINAN|nr:protein-glutamate O-methyltransferase isoform X1 [Lingula anatina]XP_013420083.1 protein-glutamate O-methyltransferase isoform X2 [Lingula anatina]|eukprot:XP_013420082.1 protein-glutamate O-methyltransferase isoform X1 [Lingula anatina]
MTEKLPPSLSAKFKDSFAYETIKDRLPVILAKTVDAVHRLKNDIKEQHGEAGMEDLKSINGKLSKLRNEVQTDKAIIPIHDGRLNFEVWNAYLEKITCDNDGRTPSWFQDAWLYVECYMYRRIQEAVEECKVLKTLDPFQGQKDQALLSSADAVSILMEFLEGILGNLPSMDDSKFRPLFDQFFELDLWGNKCDLSISAGHDNFQTESPIAMLDVFRSFLLVDNLNQMWDDLHKLNKRKDGSVRLDIVLDNAGFELISDMCLAEFLLTSKMVSEVHFHPKRFPWFVSDTTKKDFIWTLETCRTSDNKAMADFGQMWEERLVDGSWIIKEHDFWTLPHDYHDMETIAPDLYADLSKSDLILFKGDLNYRKLVGDRNWPHTTPFDVALRGFRPSALCALRTLKADVVVGLLEGQDRVACKHTARWMVTGEFAVIQYCEKKSQ